MKTSATDLLEQPAENNRKIRTPGVKGRKYHGSPNLKLKKAKTDPRGRIRRVLRECVPLIGSKFEAE